MGKRSNQPTKKGRGKAKPRPKLVLIFGENENDTATIATLLRALWPSNDWRIEARRRPPVLIKDAKPDAIPSRVQRIVALARAAETEADVVAVFAHEDCDRVEPAHEALAKKIRAAFKDSGYAVEPVVPAWEMEAWLMQWPDAFPAHVSSWRSVAHYRGRNVGLVVDAKEDLTRSLRPPNGGREYRESDAPLLAEIVARNHWARSPQALSASYRMFIESADQVSPASGSSEVGFGSSKN